MDGSVLYEACRPSKPNTTIFQDHQLTHYLSKAKTHKANVHRRNFSSKNQLVKIPVCRVGWALLNPVDFLCSTLPLRNAHETMDLWFRQSRRPSVNKSLSAYQEQAAWTCQPQLIHPVENRLSSQHKGSGGSSPLALTFLCSPTRPFNENVQTTKRKQIHANSCCVHFLKDTEWKKMRKIYPQNSWVPQSKKDRKRNGSKRSVMEQMAFLSQEDQNKTQ